MTTHYTRDNITPVGRRYFVALSKRFKPEAERNRSQEEARRRRQAQSREAACRENGQ